ncbi:TBC1 domain family member 2B [Esox lucius]|uniref:TBC1 domain family, member 2B n=1 Tax=Esox lucius TaxID=8010 RepID=A0A3P8XCU8_ESOLU|nr:TBC1 domain family member 2B [Esox lucius]
MHEEVGGEESSNQDQDSVILSSKAVDAPEPGSPKDPAKKLCGYLNKLASKGPMRGFKPRWFVYDERKCYLYYFKTPQDALPLGHIEIGDASFSYDLEGDEGQFEIRTAGKEFILKASNRQVMHYWLQQLQQRRWEFSNSRGSGQRDSWLSPTFLPSTSGLVAKDPDAFVFEKPSLSDSVERVRSDFAVETDTNGLVGVHSAQSSSHHPANPRNFTLKLGHWSTEIKNSMSGLRVGRVGGENRRSVFYTENSCGSEDWEMVDPPSAKDIIQDNKAPLNQTKPQTDTHRHSIGSPFSFDFGRSHNSSLRSKRPTLRDMMHSGKLVRSTESPSQGSLPLECDGSQTSELQLRLQSQEQELTRLRQSNKTLTEELASQKELVRLLQQTLRTTQREIRPLSVSTPATPNPVLSPDSPALDPTPVLTPVLGPALEPTSVLTPVLQPAPGSTSGSPPSDPAPGRAPPSDPAPGRAPPSDPATGRAPPSDPAPGRAPPSDPAPGRVPPPEPALGRAPPPVPAPRQCSTPWSVPAPNPEVPQQDLAQMEDLLMERDSQVQALCGHMERLVLEKESLQRELKGLKVKVGEINEQLGMLMETIQAKDEVIIKLSQTPPPGADGNAPLLQDCNIAPTPASQQEMDKLKDILQGYKSQNKFLNKEILELTFLRRNAETREKTLEAKYSALEAKLCQVESKYLVLLQELRNPVCSASDQSPARDVISRLVEDALQVDNSDPAEQTIFKPHPVSEYDVFGFKTMPEEDDEEEKLVAKVRALDMRSLSLTDQEVSVGVKWENYLASTMNRDMVRCPELKALMRSGVPHAHRSKVWRWCVAFHTKKFRDILAPDYYETLLGVARDKPNPASKQIELDLLRTLPNNKHYSSPSADGIQKLRNVLLAFSWRNPDIGYCQGLNRLAAIALLYLDQEDAFWCLITIVEVFMPRDYYTKTLLGSQVDQRVFKDLLSEKLPRLHAHFDLYKVDSSLITFNWFLVLFVDSVNSDLLFKIWDSFLYEGPKIIFRFALALFKYKEEEFLKLQDSMAIFKYLRHFTRTILDWRKLMSMAFVDMNPFPLRQIQNRRTFHLEKVRLELTELDTIRQTFLRQRDTTPSDARTLGSDDDEEN